MSTAHTVLETFLGALQGTVSVLLTFLAGYIVARRGTVDQATIKHISNLCTSLFLPSLLVVQMGPELTASSLARYWIIPLWGLATTVLAHLVGWAGQRLFGLKHWTIVACGRPNSNALPLLLLQSLEATGVLELLSADGENVAETLRRAQSLLLLNAVVQQVLTFQFAPAVLLLDDGHSKPLPDALRPGPGRLLPIVQDEERVGLLGDQEDDERDEDAVGGNGIGDALIPIAEIPDMHWPKPIAPLAKPVKLVWSYMSAPLIGAIIAFILGMIPPLHREFLVKGGIFYASITQSAKNLGGIFIALQTFSVGAELGLVPSSNPGYFQTIWVLLVRFIVMPALGLLFVWATAGRGLYVHDPLVWFLLVLIPAGPSAMLLMNVAAMVNIDQGPIAGYLTVAYLLSPLMAIVCSLGLTIVQTAEQR
ncbi:uncharacterized protein FIBRA_07673 [Fibroporia radiculosa]|uniref:Auxin efflux carrier n=1 Tax=Fibroporia radiculosa TaxID=599839 RepID=J4GF93_9APHY|nr:uncharacterized protein FIBRA_07673 [Fibroporia radiculosa]CCM05453.1 predicted protein [Fibroporia radiculosa]